MPVDVFRRVGSRSADTNRESPQPLGCGFGHFREVVVHSKMVDGYCRFGQCEIFKEDGTLPEPGHLVILALPMRGRRDWRYLRPSFMACSNTGSPANFP